MTINLDYPRNYAKLYGMNAIYAGKHWSKRREDAEFWHVYVHSELRKQGIKKRCFKNPVEIAFYWDDRLDLTNEAYAAKLIEDALKGYIIEDDSKKYVKAIHHFIHDKKCITVKIKELKP